MTLSQIKREVNALKRKYAKALAVVRLRRLAQEFCDEWDANRVEGKPAMQAIDSGQWFIKRGYRPRSLNRLFDYIRRCTEAKEAPKAYDILRPSSPGPGASTEPSSTISSRTGTCSKTGRRAGRPFAGPSTRPTSRPRSPSWPGKTGRGTLTCGSHSLPGNLNPNPPMGGVKAGQIGMREPTREKAWAPLGPCDTAEGFQ